MGAPETAAIERLDIERCDNKLSKDELVRRLWEVRRLSFSSIENTPLELIFDQAVWDKWDSNLYSEEAHNYHEIPYSQFNIRQTLIEKIEALTTEHTQTGWWVTARVSDGRVLECDSAWFTVKPKGFSRLFQFKN